MINRFRFRRARRVIAKLAALLLSWTEPARSESLPRWELGLAFSAAEFNAYRGSAASEQLIFPFPFFIYRSDRLNVGEGGARGNIFRGDQARVNVSLSSGVPVSDASLPARAGMPRLETILELGPSFEYRFWHDDSGGELWGKLPLRAAFSFDDLRIDYHGWQLSPYLEYSETNGKLKISFTAGPLFANDDYHRYFYEVERQYARSNRPEYAAEGGYGGTRFSVVLRYRWSKFTVGTYLRYDTLADAVFLDSPLVEENSYIAGGLFMAWRFWESDVRTTE